MKRLYLIGGPMGVGKTAACERLKRELDGAVFLDGDWCWDADPFQVTEETKRMVVDNICYLLNSFLRCSAYQNVIFCWVMHRQDILDGILARLDTGGHAVRAVSLVCRADVLAERIGRDVEAGLRDPDSVRRSLERLPLYDRMDTVKIDVSDLSPERTAEKLAALGGLGPVRSSPSPGG